MKDDTASYFYGGRVSVVCRGFVISILAATVASCSPAGRANPDSADRGTTEGHDVPDNASDGSLNWEAVWMPERVSLDDPRWSVADIACAGCPLASYNYMQELLQDPKNDKHSLEDIVSQVEEFSKRSTEKLLTPDAMETLARYDPTKSGVFDCTPDGDGILHQVFAPLPFEIDIVGDKVLFRYEYWNAVRPMYLDGRDHAKPDPARLGYSSARFEGSTLVVETSGLIPAPAGVPGGEIVLSSDARIAERYTLSDNGERLELVFSVIDPANFREPFVRQKAWLRSPGWELLEYECETTTGEY